MQKPQTIRHFYFLFFFIILFFITGFVVDAAEPNLLFNPGFEEQGAAGELDAADWRQQREDGDTFLTKRTDEVARNGAWSLKQSQVPKNYGREFISDTIGVVGEEKYEIGGWVYLADNEVDTETDKFEFKLEVEWSDSNSKSIDVYQVSKSLNESDTWEKWSKVSFEQTAPDTARFARFAVKGRYLGDTTTEIYWDDMFVEGPGPAPEAVVFVTQPGVTIENETMRTLKVELQDSDGLPVRWTDTDVRIEIEIDPTGGEANLSGNKTVTTKRGSGQFSGLKIDRVGRYSLEVSAEGLENDESVLFEVISTVKNLRIGPNPFRPREDDKVILQFDEYETDVDFEFEVYTLTGRRIGRKNYSSLSDNIDAGSEIHSQLHWYGASDLASGHYIYRLKDRKSGAEETGQLVIIR